MRDDEILAPLNFAKIWAHHRHLERAAEILRVLHGLPDWEYLGVYGPTEDFGVLWIYAHLPTERVWLFGLTPYFRWASDAAETCLLEGRLRPEPCYEPEALPDLLRDLGLPSGGGAGDARGDGDAAPADPLAATAGARVSRSPAQQRAYEARRRRLEALAASPAPGEMKRHQRRAYEAPIDEAKAPPGSLHPEENRHTEFHRGVWVSVLLTADVGRFGEERYGRRGMWHLSIAAWPAAPGAGRPVPVRAWTPAQKAAIEEAARRNLASIGAEETLAGEPGEVAFHFYRAMRDDERAGLGLA